MYCSFARVHKTLDMTAAMPAAIAAHAWKLEEIIALLDDKIFSN